MKSHNLDPQWAIDPVMIRTFKLQQAAFFLHVSNLKQTTSKVWKGREAPSHYAHHMGTSAAGQNQDFRKASKSQPHMFCSATVQPWDSQGSSLGVLNCPQNSTRMFWGPGKVHIP